MTLAHRAELNSQFLYFLFIQIFVLLFWQIRLPPLRIVNSHDKDDYTYSLKEIVLKIIIWLVCILWFAVQTFYALKEKTKYQALHRVSTGRPLWMV